MADWCIKCAQPRSALDPVTGWCSICTAQHKLAQQQDADEIERLRLEEQRQMEEVRRESNAIKKARERMRETYGANPRKGRNAEGRSDDL